jgi:CheY-like chemotaxis protein
MDIMTPVMNGFEAIRELRKIPEFQKTVICVLTAKGGTEDNEKVMEVGATGFLAKPFSAQDLLDKLKRLSEGKT